LLQTFFHPRQRSLLRANILVLGGLGLAILLSHFPRIQPNAWLVVPLLISIAGTADTTRHMQRRWSFYHAGVILCIYMDMMALSLILFFLLYPYLNLAAHSR